MPTNREVARMTVDERRAHWRDKDSKKRAKIRQCWADLYRTAHIHGFFSLDRYETESFVLGLDLYHCYCPGCSGRRVRAAMDRAYAETEKEMRKAKARAARTTPVGPDVLGGDSCVHTWDDFGDGSLERCIECLEIRTVPRGASCGLPDEPEILGPDSFGGSDFDDMTDGQQAEYIAEESSCGGDDL